VTNPATLEELAMNAKTTRLSVGVVLAAGLAAAAHAEYRCTPAPTSIDRRACEAADQSPEALRRFVYRMRMSNLQFSDYVDAKTERAWDVKQAQERSTEVKVATNEKR
jgi:hypothetical protein